MLEVFNGMNKETISACMAITAAILGSVASLFGYYNRQNFKVDIWGFTIINSIFITISIIIACYILNPNLKLTMPKKILPTFLPAIIFAVMAILIRIVAITYTSNISYTSTYKIIGNIIIFLGSAYVLKENFTYKGILGVLLGGVSVFLIFSEQTKLK